MLDVLTLIAIPIGFGIGWFIGPYVESVIKKIRGK